MPRKQLLYLMITFFALFVVMLGAYTRLSDSGLGCPDYFPAIAARQTIAHRDEGRLPVPEVCHVVDSPDPPPHTDAHCSLCQLDVRNVDL